MQFTHHLSTDGVPEAMAKVHAMQGLGMDQHSDFEKKSMVSRHITVSRELHKEGDIIVMLRSLNDASIPSATFERQWYV